MCKTIQNNPFYRVQKYSRCGQICRPDDLSVDRPMVIDMASRWIAHLACRFDPNGYISELYIRGLFWLVLHKIWRGFLSQFFPPFSEIFQQVLELKFYIKKSVYRSDSLAFSKKISWVFPPQIYPNFSHKSLSYPLPYLSYRSFAVRVFFVIKV